MLFEAQNNAGTTNDNHYKSAAIFDNFIYTCSCLSLFRLFLLLTSMSQLSPVQYPVISSALSLLEKLLSPILDVTQQDKSLHHSLDSRLVEWATLYVSNLLDNFMDRSQDVNSKQKR